MLRGDAATLGRCNAWIASAVAYPGRAAVVFSSVEPLAEVLAARARRHPSVDVRVVAGAPGERRREPGLDKAHRLMAAEAVACEILGDEDGVLLCCDEDVDPLDPRCVERLVAAAPRPGLAATVTNAPAPASAAPWSVHVRAANIAFNNQVYALADVLVRRIQGVLLGWTMVVWSSDLRRVGGFASATGTLTEEIELGVAFARAGIRTRLFDDSGAFAIHQEPGSLASWWHQQVRWRAQLRACPAPLLAALLLLFPLSLPVLTSFGAFVSSPGLAGALLVAAAFAVCRRTLAVEPKRLWVLPCQELLTLSALVAGLFARSVRWGPWEYRTDLRSRIVEKRWLPAHDVTRPSAPA